MIEFKLTGGKEVSALLQQLPVQMEKKIMRNALAAGARIIRDEARARAPGKSGKMRRAINVQTNVINGTVIAKIRMKGKHTYIGIFMEYGVKPHMISVGKVKRRKGEATASARLAMKIGDDFVGRSVLHPGVTAKAFLRPAMDARANDAVAAIGEYIGRWVQFGSISAPTITVDD